MNSNPRTSIDESKLLKLQEENNQLK